MKTPFEIAQEEINSGKLKTPEVSFEGKNIDYICYQLSVHHFNLKLMAKGIKFRGIKFTDIKKYYGLKGRSAKDCLEELGKIQEEYLSQLKSKRKTNYQPGGIGQF